MVSAPHEALHRIFQEDTSLFTRTFQRLGVALPTPRTVSVLSPDLTEIRPMERRADTVLFAEGTEETDDEIVIVESQSRPEPKKRRSWPYYVAYLHDKYDCDVTLLVVCPSKSTAKWAQRTIKIGPKGKPCMVVRPLVLGPDNVPAITSLAEAREDVVYTVLSALTHSRSKRAAAILEVLAAALDTIDTDSAGFLAEFTGVGLGGTAAKEVWRTLMSAQNYRYQSEFACQLREEGRAEGREEGREEGRAEGRAEGEALSVLHVLERRGIHVPSAVRDQILSCTDTTVLEGWLDRALTITSIEDLFG
jgi:hypothetical protein